jgi:hypothetical protein
VFCFVFLAEHHQQMSVLEQMFTIQHNDKKEDQPQLTVPPPKIRVLHSSNLKADFDVISGLISVLADFSKFQESPKLSVQL